MTEILDTIDACIAVYVRRNKTTRTELAAQMGMSPQTLWNKCNGRTEFTLSEFVQLCTILDTTPDVLTGRK